MLPKQDSNLHLAPSKGVVLHQTIWHCSYQGWIRTTIVKSRASSPAIRRLGKIVAKVGFEPTSCTFKGCCPAVRRLGNKKPETIRLIRVIKFLDNTIPLSICLINLLLLLVLSKSCHNFLIFICGPYRIRTGTTHRDRVVLLPFNQWTFCGYEGIRTLGLLRDREACQATTPHILFLSSRQESNLLTEASNAPVLITLVTTRKSNSIFYPLNRSMNQ